MVERNLERPIPHTSQPLTLQLAPHASCPDIPFAYTGLLLELAVEFPWNSGVRGRLDGTLVGCFLDCDGDVCY